MRPHHAHAQARDIQQRIQHRLQQLGRVGQALHGTARLALQYLILQMLDEQQHGVQRLAQVVTGGCQKVGFALTFALGAAPSRLQQLLVHIALTLHVLVDIGAERAHQGKVAQKDAVGYHPGRLAARELSSCQIAQHNHPRADHRVAHGQRHQKEPRQQHQIKAIVRHANGHLGQPGNSNHHHHHQAGAAIGQRRYRKGPRRPYPPRAVGVPDGARHQQQRRRTNTQGVARHLRRQIKMVKPHEQQHEENRGSSDDNDTTRHLHVQVVLKRLLQRPAEAQTGKAALLRQQRRFINADSGRRSA